MNSHQRRKENRIRARWMMAAVKSGGYVGAYGLSAIERRALAKVATVRYMGDNGRCYVLKAQPE